MTYRGKLRAFEHVMICIAPSKGVKNCIRDFEWKLSPEQRPLLFAWF